MNVLINGQQVDMLIGMDAEFFLRNKDGEYIAASSVIPGEKHAPFKLDNGVCHPDGLSLEVGAPPSDTAEGMIQNLFKVLLEVKEKYLDPAGVTIAYTYKVPVDKVLNAREEDLQFGCGTEFDASNPYSMIKQVTGVNKDLRFSGFHIHLGFTKDQESNYFTYLDMSSLVRKLDNLFRYLPTGKERTTQYGGFGAFRVKPYGLEYRMMDCTVITDKDKLRELIACLNKLPTIMTGGLE